jgi:hypothetical protein
MVPTAVDTYLVQWRYFLISTPPLFTLFFQAFGLTAMETILKNNSLQRCYFAYLSCKEF